MPLATGCTSVGDPASARGLHHNDLVGELAAQLATAPQLTYVATYQLAGGATATIAQAQDPVRAMYRYPGGEVLVTPSAITRCERLVCTMTAPAATPPPATFAGALAAGLVTPASVEQVLTAARDDPDLTVAQHDTTVAGRHATCVELGNVDASQDAEAPGPAGGAPPTGTPPTGTPLAGTPPVDTPPVDTPPVDTPPAGMPSEPPPSSPSGTAPPAAATPGHITACITSDRLVGSFTGTVDGVAIDLALTDYADRAGDANFLLPTSAKIIDRRAG